jgi:hypothetical protein
MVGTSQMHFLKWFVMGQVVPDVCLAAVLSKGTLVKYFGILAE